MAYLSAAVAIVGVLCVLDLVLTFGVIRRLRDHSGQLTSARSNAPAQAKPMLEPGATVGRFSTVLVTGEDLPSDFFHGQTLIGFFSPDCAPCKKMLPEFVDRAAEMPQGRARVLAVVVGDPEAAIPLVAALEPVAQVVIESRSGKASSAFDVSGYPSVFTVDENRTVTGSGHIMAALRMPAAVGQGR